MIIVVFGYKIYIYILAIFSSSKYKLDYKKNCVFIISAVIKLNK